MLAGVLTTLDAVTGEQTVTERLLAHKQLGFADRIALTKADLLGSDIPTQRDRKVQRSIDPAI